MSDKVYDVPEVLAALEAAVAEKGVDYVYTDEDGRLAKCRYVHYRDSDNPTPGCIVGQVYWDLTGKLVPPELEVGIVNAGPAPEWLEEGTFTPAAIRFLGEVQMAQDSGIPWGKAVAYAREADGV